LPRRRAPRGTARTQLDFVNRRRRHAMRRGMFQLRR
jgi:hypothetical protein